MPFRPTLSDQEARLDGLAQTDLIGEDRPAGQRIAEREQGRFDLVRVEINLSIGENRRQPFDAVGRTTPRQLVGDVLGVVRRELHGGGQQRVAQNVLRRWFMARLRRLRRHRVLPALSILAEGRILGGQLVSIRAIRDADSYRCRREFLISPFRSGGLTSHLLSAAGIFAKVGG